MSLRPMIVAVSILCGAASAHAAQPDGLGSAALTARGWAAIDQQRYGDALNAFTAVVELAPEDPTAWLGGGFAAYMLGHDADAEQRLRYALTLEPRLTDASRILGDLYYRSGRVREAIAVAEEALEHAPRDAQLASRVERWKAQDALHDGFFQSRGAHFKVLFEGHRDDALARRIVEMLEAAYLEVGGRLGAYPAEAVTVVLYTQEQFQDITRSPAWAAGAYDGQIRVPVAGALENRRELERVLTHEFVHALVAPLSGRLVPAWLNEGLATYFEPGGLARASRVLAATSDRPALGELHAGFARLPTNRAAVAYALSAVAVGRLIYRNGPSAVLSLLGDLGQGISFPAAFHRRMALPYDEFERVARGLR